MFHAVSIAAIIVEIVLGYLAFYGLLPETIWWGHAINSNTSFVAIVGVLCVTVFSYLGICYTMKRSSVKDLYFYPEKYLISACWGAVCLIGDLLVQEVWHRNIHFRWDVSPDGQTMTAIVVLWTLFFSAISWAIITAVNEFKEEAKLLAVCCVVCMSTVVLYTTLCGLNAVLHPWYLSAAMFGSITIGWLLVMALLPIVLCALCLGGLLAFDFVVNLVMRVLQSKSPQSESSES